MGGRGPDKKPRIRTSGYVVGDVTGYIPPEKDFGYSDETKNLPDSQKGVRGRPVEIEAGPDVNPNPTEIIVEGRSPMLTWGNPEKRAAFERWRVQAEEVYGLIVHEVEPGGVARRKWARIRVSLDEALTHIKTSPGILFDDWLKLYLGGLPENATSLAAARKKAAVALSALYKDSKVEKRYASSDGRMLLYPFGKVPK